jgi:ferredoxin
MPKLVYLRNVTTLALDEAKCVGCGLCQAVCPHGVLVVTAKKAAIDDRNACMECGACALNCPAGALSVRAGVGCATAIIGQTLGRRGSLCCP